MTDVSTNFSFIKLVAKASNSEKVDLNAIFEAVIKGNLLEVDETHLTHILENDLSVTVSKLDQRLLKVLSECLIYYMAIWPGWQRSIEYEKGDLQYKDWFEKYRMYLMYKCNFVVKSNVECSETNVDVDNKGTQTEENIVANVKKVAPFSVTVGGSPEVLNNIVFIENNGDVLIKQHAGKPWNALTLLEFLNWPHVSVEVKLPDLSFTRTVSHVYERFIGIKGDTMVFPEIRHIVNISKLQNNVELQPYTYNFLESYIFQLLNVLDQLPCVSKERLIELRTILMQFLKDIEEINVYDKTMSSNACVTFHIGSCRYIRNKKMVNNGNVQYTMRHSINFYEIINPQIDLALIHCDAKQDLSQQNTVTFESLNNLLLKTSIVDSYEDVLQMGHLINEKCITYSCTLCKQRFEGLRSYNSMLLHFRCLHKSQQAVLCYKCGRQFELRELAGKRWAHVCSVQK